MVTINNRMDFLKNKTLFFVIGCMVSGVHGSENRPPSARAVIALSIQTEQGRRSALSPESPKHEQKEHCSGKHLRYACHCSVCTIIMLGTVYWFTCSVMKDLGNNGCSK